MSYDWQRYKKLELIPGSAPEPRRNNLASLNKMWQLFLNTLMQKHLYEQQTDI